MDGFHYRLNFDPSKKDEIYQDRQKEHLEINRIVKFGREILWNADSIDLMHKS